jgi:uncharacterized protein with ATP-grasp and redox domains
LITFVVPPCQADPIDRPPLLMTSEPGSFAYGTFKYRIPAIVQETISLNEFPDGIRGALEALRLEVLDGKIRGLQEDTRDRTFWDAVSQPYVGRTWLDVPWYWAEAFFYRRVLEATRYFQPGAWHGYDPYTAKKQTEWQPHAAPRLLAAALAGLSVDPHTRFEALLHYSLWGNRTDLSYNVAAAVGRPAHPDEDRSNLLVDDTWRIWQHLSRQACRRLAIVADNTGTELLMDLALTDFLLSHELVEQVTLHLKPQPFFVSDAMSSDVEAGLQAIKAGEAIIASLERRVRAYLNVGRLTLDTHWVYASSLFYSQLPDDLRAQLAATDLVLLKGDVNYRRLLGDAHWPPTTPYEQATAYFPAPLASLRTLKGELIVGLAQGQAEALHQQDAEWMFNGRRGVIQARL